MMNVYEVQTLVYLIRGLQDIATRNDLMPPLWQEKAGIFYILTPESNPYTYDPCFRVNFQEGFPPIVQFRYKGNVPTSVATRLLGSSVPANEWEEKLPNAFNSAMQYLTKVRFEMMKLP